MKVIDTKAFKGAVKDMSKDAGNLVLAIVILLISGLISTLLAVPIDFFMQVIGATAEVGRIIACGVWGTTFTLAIMFCVNYSVRAEL